MSDIRQKAQALADRLFAELKAGRLAKIDLEEIEAAARDIEDAQDRKLVVDWTVRFVVEKAAKG